MRSQCSPALVSGVRAISAEDVSTKQSQQRGEARVRPGHFITAQEAITLSPLKHENKVQNIQFYISLDKHKFIKYYPQLMSLLDWCLTL